MCRRMCLCIYFSLICTTTNIIMKPTCHELSSSSRSSRGPSKDEASSLSMKTLPLCLSVHPEDGCLLTAPLSTVLNTATDSLYRDLHDMTYSNVTLAIPSSATPVSTAAATAVTATSTSSSSTPISGDGSQMKFSLHTGTMASLSFAQRRFLFASQLIYHARSISHVSALVSAYLPLSSGDASLYSTASSSSTNTTLSLQPQEGELSHIVTALTNPALHQVQTSWTQADEAQDALFFKHADLYKYRKQVQDVLGAMEVLLSGSWKLGMSWDVALLPPSASWRMEKNNTVVNKQEEEEEESDVKYRLQRAVQSKLVLGEVGFMDTQQQPLPWNMSLEQEGCVLKLTYGSSQVNAPDKESDDKTYPLVAYLTVLSEQAPNATVALQETEEDVQYNEASKMIPTTMGDPPKSSLSSSFTSSSSHVAPWTLLSIEVNQRSKMGESIHQLSPTNRQLFDLHRICVRNMAMEESRAWMAAKKAGLPTTTTTRVVARPLDRLFDTLYTFSLGLQMEILSAQAMALKKGTWDTCITVDKVLFDFESQRSGVDSGSNAATNIKDEEKKDFYEDTDTAEDHRSNTPFAKLAIHFWDVDDRYGRPALGNICIDTIGRRSDSKKSTASKSESYIQPTKEPTHSKSLTVVVQAIRRIGVQVFISGGKDVTNVLHHPAQASSSSHSHLKKYVNQLLSSLGDPFRLSMSDALLAATTICAQMRCAAIVRAFQRIRTSSVSSTIFPCWLHLQSLESGCIAVAAEISYHGVPTTEEDCKRDPVILFHLTCECRTGRFITTFPQSFNLLRRLACNDWGVSETQTLRQSVANMHSMTSSMVKRKQAGSGADKDLTGRIVRDAFEALNRSMDVLGRRIGVGGECEDIDEMSSALRTKYIDQACDDVKPSLMLCSALASTYGIACVALGISTCVDATPDIAGGPIDNDILDNSRCINAPPLSVLRNQRLVEKEEPDMKSGESKTKYILKRDLVGVSSCYRDDILSTIFYDISVEQESLYAAQHRTKCIPLNLNAPGEIMNLNSLLHTALCDTSETERPHKRIRTEIGVQYRVQTAGIKDEISYLSARLISNLQV